MTDTNLMLIEAGQNLIVILALTFVFGYLLRWANRTQRRVPGIVYGLLFAVIAIIGMTIPVQLAPGVFIDARNALVMLAAPFGGPWASLVAGLIVSGYRLNLGGIGANAGAIAVVCSALIGIFYTRFVQISSQPPSPKHLVALGLALSTVTLPWALAMPQPDMAKEIFNNSLIPALIFFPVATVLIGSFLSREVRQANIDTQLKAAQQRAETYLSVSEAMIIALDKRGCITTINGRGCEILDASRDQIVGANWIETFIPQEHRETVTKVFDDIICGDIEPLEYFENEIISASGQRRYIHWHNTLVRDAGGAITGTLSSGQDLTESKKIERDLAQSMKQFRTLFERATDAIFVIDAKTGEIENANALACRECGYTRGEMLTLSVFDISPELTRDNFPIITRNIINGSMPSIEAEHKCKDGSLFPVEVRARGVELNGQIKLLALARNMTERKRVERAMTGAKQDAELANRLKANFLANMSHELRTPLNSIIGFSQLVENEMLGPLPDNYKEYMGIIGRSGARLLALVEDILDLSRIEAGKIELREAPIDLPPMFDDLVRLVEPMSTKAKVPIRITVDPNLPRLLADQMRVEQILINLLSNAIKFSPGGVINLSARLNGGAIHMTVQDTGIGLKPEDIEMVFSPFGQVNQNHMTKQIEGTGLGLPLARQLAQLHGGSLSLISELGEGTQALLVFPEHRSIATSPPAQT